MQRHSRTLTLPRVPRICAASAGSRNSIPTSVKLSNRSIQTHSYDTPTRPCYLGRAKRRLLRIGDGAGLLPSYSVVGCGAAALSLCDLTNVNQRKCGGQAPVRLIWCPLMRLHLTRTNASVQSSHAWHSGSVMLDPLR
ncbi:hypothetical protein PHSY_002842 [Pseudozyma hubeiensis SY62]|uniref:Uncharacterized protein n=1 Tax=Pseudozyma hubeiensis (strain SY62) TaxID=1305764 RepID=R9P248_PSEHS|nr:hypothetical protein PHSY_002842 [Pseudozyma hubeiensis SY62]GAC95267.1 hypothetical protein PHSY_002842 [Pseudozyma hubeiensis SY62]